MRNNKAKLLAQLVQRPRSLNDLSKNCAQSGMNVHVLTRYLAELVAEGLVEIDGIEYTASLLGRARHSEPVQVVSGRYTGPGGLYVSPKDTSRHCDNKSIPSRGWV